MPKSLYLSGDYILFMAFAFRIKHRLYVCGSNAKYNGLSCFFSPFFSGQCTYVPNLVEIPQNQRDKFAYKQADMAKWTQLIVLTRTV